MSRIILASASPRRKEILEVFTSKFSIMAADIVEKIHTGEEPKHIAMTLSLEKALKVMESCSDGDIIIAADTIVVKGEIFGKPANHDEAFQMIKTLQNDIHEVITGISIVQAGTNKKFVSYSTTEVKFKQLTDELIRRYIDTEEVLDKAGAYAIQGKGAAMVEWINGDYFNVVGLPISQVVDILSRHFNIELF